MMDNLFLDTSYAVALAIERDQYHDRAVRLVDVVEQENARLITTRAVIIEIGNYLSAPRYRPTAINDIAAFERDRSTEIVPLSEALFRRGCALYQSRLDKAWSLTDCISFVVMRERGLTDALTADRHFEQAGFKALLRVS